MVLPVLSFLKSVGTINSLPQRYGGTAGEKAVTNHSLSNEHGSVECGGGFTAHLYLIIICANYILCLLVTGRFIALFG